MLNIPSSVKALFQADGVHKNFRVHFPNGEMADITNDNVVQESVKFTESLCSQSTFKFGLAEASVLEFETVGIANMYGMTIQASCEIDCSSLSAADKTAIAAGTWDGTWDSVNEVFAVPYGTFRVESCPRDHQSMAHRQVTAYTAKLTNSILSEFELKRAAKFVPASSMSIDVWPYAYAQLGSAYPNFRQNAFTRSILYDENNMNHNSYTDRYGGISEDGNYRLRVSVDSLNIDGSNLFSYTEIVGVDAADIDLQGAYEFVQNAITQYGVRDKFTNPEVRISESVGWCYSINGAVSGQEAENSLGVVMYANAPMLYPKFTNARGFGLPTYIKIELLKLNPTTVIDTFETQATYSPVVYSYTPNDTLPQTIITIEHSSEVTFNIAGNQITNYSYVDCFKPADLLQGALEISAEFAKADRFGGFEMVRLENSSPISIAPDDYSDMWWDEFDVDPIGTVTITYQDTDENGNEKENTADVTIGAGQSRYDMSNNEMARGLNGTSYNDVVSLIMTNFAPYVGAVAFTPTELTMHGWPWIEAGDALEITAEDGTVVESYALRVEMSGIQHLQATITAEGGEIIEEVE